MARLGIVALAANWSSARAQSPEPHPAACRNRTSRARAWSPWRARALARAARSPARLAATRRVGSCREWRRGGGFCFGARRLAGAAAGDRRSSMPRNAQRRRRATGAVASLNGCIFQGRLWPAGFSALCIAGHKRPARQISVVRTFPLLAVHTSAAASLLREVQRPTRGK